MAIYHFNVKIISRGKGRNAVASIAYRRATKIFDEQCNRTWNYENKPDVVHSEITIPANSPQWVKNLDVLQQESLKSSNVASQHLWNLVEKSEERIDARLAREVEFSLPIELNEEQSVCLAREFIQNQFSERGMIADWSIHWDKGNPHVHVMLTTRELVQSGFGKKVSEWNDKSLLYVWREKWAEYANFHLKLHQHNVRIDHRSYKDQGIDLIPSIHRGHASEEIEKREKLSDRKAEYQEIKKENLKRILQKPELLARKIFQTIEHHESVFREKDLAKALLAYVDDDAEFYSAMESIKKSKALISLGVGEDGQERYTTRRMFDIENNIQATTEKLQKRNHIRIAKHKIDKAIERYQVKIGKRLTSEQRTAVEHLVSKTAIACVLGKAGTGKSFTLGAANAVWKAKGLNVYGIAPTGKAARTLQKEAGIPSRTIESFRFCVENGIITLTSRDVIVMDEAGMTDCIAMESVLTIVNKTNAKLAVVGDLAQLQPVGPGSPLRAVLERLHLKHEVLQHVYRQNEEWQREATKEFSKGYTREAVNRYYQNGFINFRSDDYSAKQKLVDDWDGLRKLKNRLKPQDLKDYLVMAHRNKDVKELNMMLRQKRIEQNEITKGYTVNSSRGEIHISSGDRILFLLNDKEIDVSNGHFGEIKNIRLSETGKVLSFTVVLDDEPTKQIVINPSIYRDFTYGYAATVHKSQGATFNHSFVYLGGRWWNQYLAYVAMSRHRESCHVYANKQTHRNIEALKNNVSRKPRKDSVLDYPLAFCERRGINNEGFLQKLPALISEKLKQVREKIKTKFIQNNKLCLAENSHQIDKPPSLPDLLKQYVELEIKQAELVSMSHAARCRSLEESRHYSVLAVENSLNMQKFSEELMGRSEMGGEIENNRFSVIKIYEVGGFKAIQERLNKKEYTQQDINILITLIRSKSENLARNLVNKKGVNQVRHY
ncbi:MAG: Ti-type conjugative transfer relaxase TraA [Gammaproteobacteria bacterium]|nr:Ti-type conjugative transfer relaxase TraA [Gammaproteobacteria bacterium]